jgi:hypothetical protein
MDRDVGMPGSRSSPSGLRASRARAVALAVYFGVFWILILLPLDFHRPRSILGDLHSEFMHSGGEITVFISGLMKSAGHALLFLPLGPLLAWGGQLPARGLFRRGVLLCVAVLSLVAELAQLSVSRGCSASDFVMNLVGFMAGALLLGACRRPGPGRRIFDAVTAPGLLALYFLAFLSALYVLLLPTDRLLVGPGGLESWNPLFPLCVGNERTGRRPWLGTLRSLTIWDRALDEEHARSLSAGGLDLAGAGSGSLPDSVVAAHAFGMEDFILDATGAVKEVRAARGPVLHAEGGGARPALEGGVEFHQASLLRGEEGWGEGIEKLRRSSEFSVQVSFIPRRLNTYDLARMVSSSWSNRERNFTLGQAGDGLEFRVRTALSGRNGAKPSLRVPGCLETGRSACAVATYRGGKLRLYLGGKAAGGIDLSWLTAMSEEIFSDHLTKRVSLGLGAVIWACAFSLLWAFFRRMGRRGGWTLLVSAMISAVMIAGVVWASGVRTAFA